MQKLRGSGNTFSTSGKRWFPYRGNPRVARSVAQRAAIKHAFPADKASARALCAEAVAAHPIKRIP